MRKSKKLKMIGPDMMRSFAPGLAFLCAAAALAPAGDAATATTPWVEMTNLPGGAAGSIVFNPNNPNIGYVGAVEGGGAIFHTTNGGATFTKVKVGGLEEAFRAIAVDPKPNSKIAFAFSSKPDSAEAGSVYESTDNGVTWTRLAKQPKPSGTLVFPGAGYARGIAVDPTGTKIVLADSYQGLFYSDNLGKSWTNTIPASKSGPYALATDPDQPNVLLAVGNDNANGGTALWKSTNFGKSWTETEISLPGGGGEPRGIIVLPKSGKILVSWNGYNPATGIQIAGVIGSTDGGKSWTDSKGLASDFSPGNGMVADPSVPTTVFLATNGVPYPHGLYKSTDSGATWTPSGIAGSSGTFTVGARPAAKGVTSAVFADGNLSSTDHGVTWTRLNNGYDADVPYTITEDFAAAGGIYGNSSGGLFHSANSGKSWTRISTWSGAAFPSTFAVDPAGSSHTIYAATATALLRSTDVGKSWTVLTSPIKAGNIGQLLADRTQAGRVYVTESSGDKIYRSDNSGKTWTAGVAIGTSGNSFSAYPNPLVADPIQAGVLYAGMSSGVWKSTNSGGSWTMLKGTGNIASLAASTANSATDLFATSYLPNGVGTAMQVSIKGGKFSSITDPAGQSSLTAGPSGAAVFAFAGNQVCETKTAGKSWITIDNSIEQFLEYIGTVSITPTNIYVTDSNSDVGYTAPLAKLTGPTVTVLPQSALQDGPGLRKAASAFRPGQLARHFAE